MAPRRGPDRVVREEHHAPPASTFLRGLSLGALVGAAVAGSVLLGRRRGRRGRSADAAGTKPAVTGG
jgi:hypothetical protein